MDGIRIQVSPQVDIHCFAANSVDCGVSDSSRNLSWLPSIPQSHVDIPPLNTEKYGDDPRAVKAAVIADVQSLFAGIGIEVTDQRPPPDVAYSMVVIGGHPSDIGQTKGIAGLAPLDCANANPRDISFVFSEVLGSISAISRVTVQEAAHTFGLEHESFRDFVMHPEPIKAEQGLSKTCVPLLASPDLSNPDGIKCLHACNSLRHQNAFAELRERFGDHPDNPLPEDRQAPTLEFISPADGTWISTSPANLRIDLKVSDDLAAVSTSVSINDSTWVQDDTYPFAFLIRNLKPGSYEVVASVKDIVGKESKQSILVSVGHHSSHGTNRPMLDPEQIQPYTEDHSGKTVRCTTNAACYEGTQCLDGLCLRSFESGCNLLQQSGHKTKPFSWTLGHLGLMLVLTLFVCRIRNPTS